MRVYITKITIIIIIIIMTIVIIIIISWLCCYTIIIIMVMTTIKYTNINIIELLPGVVRTLQRIEVAAENVREAAAEVLAQ